MEKINIKELYKTYLPLVHRYCYNLLRNHEDAQNAAQNVFEDLLKAEDRLEIRSSKGPLALLYTMARNASFDESKKRKKDIYMFYSGALNISLKRIKGIGKGELMQLLKSEIAAKNVFNTENNLEDENYEQVDAQMFVNSILNEEDEKTRLIYFMRYHNDMTLEDIGEIVGLRKSAVAKRINKLKENVRLNINKEIK